MPISERSHAVLKGWSQLPILGINNDKNCLDLYKGYKLTNKNHLLHWKSVNTLANLLEALLPKYKQTGTRPHMDTMPCNNSTFPRLPLLLQFAQDLPTVNTTTILVAWLSRSTSPDSTLCCYVCSSAVRSNSQSLSQCLIPIYGLFLVSFVLSIVHLTYMYNQRSSAKIMWVTLVP